MVPTKSHVTFLRDLVSKCLLDGASQSTPRDLDRDIETVVSRVDQEGIGFLTKTLPSLGKALDEALESGIFFIPRSFKKASKGCHLPAFMQVSFKSLFDSSGRLLPGPDPYAVRHIRQICYMFYKYELPSSPEQNEAAIAKFHQIEKELYLQDLQSNELLLGASYLLRDLFEDFDPSNIVPKHGPGAVATGERLEEKYSFKRLLLRANQLYPFMNYFMSGGFNELESRFDWYMSLVRVDETRSKICLVPKDSRGPRLISTEPLEQMFLQQGLSVRMVEHIEKHRFTRGHVNFTDQTVNRDLAHESSITRTYATLDLSDASDRISLQLVQLLFDKTSLLEALESLRSTCTLTPKGETVPLFKHAPMGSALCFPVLACAVWALLVTGLSQRTKVAPQAIMPGVFVYGDDIIVKSEYAEHAVAILHSVGLLVNKRKSYVNGHFRESCGMDAFLGIDVTPTRVKTVWTEKSSDGGAYVSYVSTANHLRAKGYVSASQHIIRQVARLYGRVPYVTRSSALPGIVVESLTEAIQLNQAEGIVMKIHPDYQSPMARGSFLTPMRRDSELDDWPRLLRSLTVSAGDDPSVVVLPLSTKIRRGWRVIC
jgi:hypothetical protein